MTDVKAQYPDTIAPALASGVARRTYQLLIETVDVRTEYTLDYLIKTFPTWQYWMGERLNARLICANATLTGRPGRIIHVWWVEWGFSLAEQHAAIHDAAQRPEGSWLAEMFGYLNDVSYDLLFPTHYDPGRCWTAPGAERRCSCVDAPAADPTQPPCIDTTLHSPNTNDPSQRCYRLLDVIQVRPGRLAALAGQKKRCFVENARRLGIQLVASGTRVAAPRQLVQVWNLPSPDALELAMKRFSDMEWYQDMSSTDIASEQQELLLPAWPDPRPTLIDNCWQFEV